MKIRKTTRYIAECGKGFWSKQDCLNHEKKCTCWSNRKNKTCKTCWWGKTKDEDGIYNCHSSRKPEWEHTGGPVGVDYISVNCDYYD